MKLVKTEDGSSSVFIPVLEEYYHSKYGAVTESMHIFIERGLRFMNQSIENINILEIGFGTGLNAFLTFIESQKSLIKINYTAIEAFPLAYSLISQLNYTQFFGYRNIFKNLHTAGWNKFCMISDNFSLLKLKTDLLEYQPHLDIFDLVYFDAFAPQKQSELWTIQVFEKINRAMKMNAMLVTYSTKGSVKRNLISCGFSIELLPGPKGKREILRARKITSI